MRALQQAYGRDTRCQFTQGNGRVLPLLRQENTVRDETYGSERSFA